MARASAGLNSGWTDRSRSSPANATNDPIGRNPLDLRIDQQPPLQVDERGHGSQDAPVRGRRSKSSITRTWCGRSASQRRNTTLRSAVVAPAAKLGKTTPVHPADIDRSAMAQRAGVPSRVARSFHGQARSDGPHCGRWRWQYRSDPARRHSRRRRRTTSSAAP